MKDAEKKRYRAALGIAYACTEGSNAVLRLLKWFSLEDIWAAGLERLEKMGMSKFPAAKLPDGQAAVRGSRTCWTRRPRALEAAGLRFVPFGSADYPATLLDLSHPPAGIFLKGRSRAPPRSGAQRAHHHRRDAQDDGLRQPGGA